MNPDNAHINKIQKLIDKLNYYTKKYDEGKPEISDKEWDDMYFHLQDLENFYGIYCEDSPTQRVNFQVVNELKKVTHNHPMLSLDKTKDIKEIEKFIGNKDYICMAKLDGLTCSLRYLDGKLIGAETRGNGIVGEDVLHNVLQIKNVPKKINFKDELIVDGEVLCTYEDFEYYKDEYKNPRNFASGGIRLLDSKESASRRLSFIAWDCIKGLKEETLSAKLMQLEKLGFTEVPFEINFPEYTLESIINQVKNSSKNIFPTDGLVFKYDNCSEYEAAGRTDHHFKGGIALKFYDENYDTVLRDIKWTMGRTGVLTPVAIFDPIDIDGTEVSKASLHNISVAQETLHTNFTTIGWEGQHIKVAKMNMIIPQITEAEEDIDGLTKFYFDIPKICPICNKITEIKKENNSEMLYCVNSQCEGKLVNRIEHFFGKKGLDAKGISKATIEKLINWGWVNKISDMFELSAHETEWKNITGFGEKSVNNILQSIRESCNTNFESIISAAGIPLIGRTIARDLSKKFDGYGEFREAIKNGFDFTQYGGYGYEMQKAISEFNYNELDNIVEKYLTIKKNNDIINTEKLKDITFCITGKVNIWKNRDELSQTIVLLGGKVVGSVSKNVNYLINNDITSNSSKNLKAKDLGIKIISEQDFQKMFDIQK
jgi:DNA ligase (NAD+)